jgi:protein-tyrosine phosphatase
MAETIFNALASDAGLPLRAESAGTAALEGRSIAPNAVAALKEVGFNASEHQARQVTREMIASTRLVLAMTPQHLVALQGISQGSERLYTLANYATGAAGAEGISDPYGLTMTAYRSSVRQLYEYTERVISNLAEVSPPT